MGKRAKLSEDRIVDAAVAMIDREGVDNLSMRKLAGELGVNAMAIYHYHANKNALIHDVMQRMFDEYEMPEPTDDWRQDLRNLCQALRVLGAKHPGSFLTYVIHYDEWLQGEHRILEAFHSTIMRSGLSNRKTAQAVRVIYSFCETFIYDEITGWLEEDDKEEYVESLQQGAYPSLLELVDEVSNRDGDEEFSFGLDVFITGIQTKLS